MMTFQLFLMYKSDIQTLTFLIKADEYGYDKVGCGICGSEINMTCVGIGLGLDDEPPLPD
jgi:hypothetical protein